MCSCSPWPPDTDTLGRLIDLAHATFHQELSLHRDYAAEYGLAEAGPGPGREVAGLLGIGTRQSRMTSSTTRDQIR